MLRDLFPRTHDHYEGSRFAGDLEAFAEWLRAVGYSRPSAHRHVYRLDQALGHQAARDGFSVLYRRLPRLLDDLAIARVAGRHRQAFAKLARTRLLVIDDWAMTRLTAEQRRDLMEVIDDRHDRAATILVSQIPVSGWFDQIGDATYADALLDRIVHNAYRIELRGESMRRRITASSEEDTTTAAT